MAEWKKVLVSGSNIEVGQITASLNESSKPHIVVYDTGSGALHYTSSDSIGNSVQYQTGSGTLIDLTQLKILDYDSNVFVTSSGGQLILQFGTPALPTINSFIVSASSFRTNRFSGPGAGVYVIDDDYGFILNYTLDPTNTFVSASLLTNIEGTPTEITTSLDSDGSLTFKVDTTNSYINYLHSGSQYFTASLCVQLEDGSNYNIDTPLTTGNTILSKTNPTNPTLNSTWNIWPSTTYATNTSSTSTTTSVIEKGVTGSIEWYSSTTSPSNGWVLSSVDPTSGSPSTRTISSTATPSNLIITASWTSDGLGTPSTIQTTRTKSFSRIVSLRYGALSSGVFSDNLSPTESELLDLLKWTDNGGIIDFNNTNPNGDTFTISWSGDKYHYIIMDNSYTLNQISIDGFGSIGAFTTGTTTSYRFYVTTDIQAGGAGSSAEFVLST